MTTSDIPENEVPSVVPTSMEELMKLLGPTPEQIEEAKQAEERGKAELSALGDSIDDDLLEFMKLVGDWGEKVRDKFNLSPEAMCVLTEMFPGFHECWHAEQNERRNNERKNTAIS